MPAQSALAIETSVETGSVAIWSEGKVILERSFRAGRKPSATLWPALEKVITDIRSLDVIIVGIGPGSYNGSRVAIAAAQGMAMVYGCPVVPLCSFEGVVPESGQSLAIGDARRGNFSLQKVASGRLVDHFELVEKEALVAAISDALAASQEVFSFDEAERFALPTHLAKAVVRRQSEAGNLLAAFFARVAADQEALCLEAAEPFYLRDPHITVGKRKSLLD